MSLMAKLQKASTVKATSVVSDSEFFKDKELVDTGIPMLNVALSGEVDGGLAPGLTVIAGQSKHYKSNLSLVMAAAYLRKYPDAVLLIYDTEFGITPEYLENFGLDRNRILHTPIEHVEQLKFDIVRQLEALEKNDKVFILIDSIGNLASKKELEDALDEKSVSDMTRAKSLKGLFRMVTPYLNTRSIPLVCVNHTYKEIGMFPKDIMSGGTGIYYSANQIFFMGRRQNKTGTEVTGYDFVINVEKSRFVREKSKIPITVSWEGGVEQYSGLLDVAMAGGFVVKPSNGWYSKMDVSTGAIEDKKYRMSETLTDEFWSDLLASDQFRDYITRGYQIGGVIEEIEMDLE